MLLEQESCNIYEWFLDHLEKIRKQNNRRAGGTDGAAWATTAAEGRGRSQWHRALVVSTKLTEIAGTILVGTCSHLILYVLYHCKCLMCTSFVPLATGSGRLSSLIRQYKGGTRSTRTNETWWTCPFLHSESVIWATLCSVMIVLDYQPDHTCH